MHLMFFTPNTKMGTKFTEHIETGLDANSVGAVSASLEIKENTVTSMQVIANTGGNTTHQIDLQCSTNNVNWHNVGSGVIGVGIEDALTVGARYIRARVSTAEGGASTVDVYLQAK